MQYAEQKNRSNWKGEKDRMWIYDEKIKIALLILMTFLIVLKTHGLGIAMVLAMFWIKSV